MLALKAEDKELAQYLESKINVVMITCTVIARQIPLSRLGQEQFQLVAAEDQETAV